MVSGCIPMKGLAYRGAGKVARCREPQEEDFPTMKVLDRDLDLGTGGWLFFLFSRKLNGGLRAPGREPRVYHRQEAW